MENKAKQKKKTRYDAMPSGTGRRILDAKKAEQKIERMVFQILENNFEIEELVILGIANKGFKLSQQICERLEKVATFKIHHSWIKINKVNPIEPIKCGDSLLLVNKAHYLIIDDVGNTGRTLFYVMRELSKHIASSIECAVLVERTHKSFPIHVNYVGLALATTYKEEVIVEFDKNDKVEGAYLY